jgi:hypothetical protein
MSLISTQRVVSLSVSLDCTFLIFSYIYYIKRSTLSVLSIWHCREVYVNLFFDSLCFEVLTYFCFCFRCLTYCMLFEMTKAQYKYWQFERLPKEICFAVGLHVFDFNTTCCIFMRNWMFSMSIVFYKVVYSVLLVCFLNKKQMDLSSAKKHST